MLVFEQRGKLEKNLSEQGENQQQTQPTYDAGSGNQTRATLVGGEHSDHCATLAPLLLLRVCYSAVLFPYQTSQKQPQVQALVQSCLLNRGQLTSVFTTWRQLFDNFLMAATSTAQSKSVRTVGGHAGFPANDNSTSHCLRSWNGQMQQQPSESC